MLELVGMKQCHCGTAPCAPEVRNETTASVAADRTCAELTEVGPRRASCTTMQGPRPMSPSAALCGASTRPLSPAESCCEEGVHMTRSLYPSRPSGNGKPVRRSGIAHICAAEGIGFVHANFKSGVRYGIRPGARKLVSPPQMQESVRSFLFSMLGDTSFAVAAQMSSSSRSMLWDLTAPCIQR
jgi:hypothetical protein